MGTATTELLLTEALRRKPRIEGLPFPLANGENWLFAIPRFRASQSNTIQERLHDTIDRLFAASLLDGYVELSDICQAASILLLENYELSDSETASLLDLRSDERWKLLTDHVIGLLFGVYQPERTYFDWVKHSLLSNGLGSLELDSRDTHAVLSLLVATSRTVPVDRYVDACLVARDCRQLDALI